MTDPIRPGPDPSTDTTRTPVGDPIVPNQAEPTSAATATSPVAPPPTAGTRSRGRWIAALALVGVVIAGSAAAAFLLTGAAPAATVTGYVPAGSVAYGEFRLDLPGDQRAELGEFLSKFPGFDDQAALDTKLDEVLDRLLSEGTDGRQTFTRDIKPWFGGEVAFAMGPLPDAEAMTTGDAMPRGLVLISITNEQLARDWFAKAMAEGDTGVSVVTQDYQGTQLSVVASPDDPAKQAAFGILGGKVAVAGDLESVKAAVDTKGGSEFANDPAIQAASESLTGDHVASMVIDLEAITAATLALGAEAGASLPPTTATMLALVPDWAAFRLRVEGDALVMDGVMPDVEGAPGPQANRVNGVAAWAPASTVFLTTGNDAGRTVLDMIALYRQDPTLAETFEGVDQAAGMLGGLDAALGWLGDTGLVVSTDGDKPEGGILSIPADAAGARQFLTTIRSFATLAGGQAGIEVREEDHAGTTITIVDLGSASDLAGLAGGGDAVPVPTDVIEGNVELAYAATDAVVVIGSGPDFVKAVLDAGAGASLADDARFQGLVARVGAEHTGLSFVDLAAIRTLVEANLDQLPAEERAEYEESIQPFLAPFDAVVQATTAGDELDGTHAIVTVK